MACIFCCWYPPDKWPCHWCRSTEKQARAWMDENLSERVEIKDNNEKETLRRSDK